MKQFLLNNFLGSGKKGGKKFRYFLGLQREAENIATDSRSFSTHKALVGTDPPDAPLKKWFNSWCTFSFPNDFKTFIFNCRYNYLPLNNRTNSYRPEVDPRCTFCILTQHPDPARDSFVHCFYECPFAKNLLLHLCTFINLEIEYNSQEFRRLYWYGTSADALGTEKNNMSVFLVFFDAFRYILYRNRLRRMLPSNNESLFELSFFLQCILMSNKKLKLHFLNTEFLSRIFQARG
jgi:hypothetical protein